MRGGRGGEDVILWQEWCAWEGGEGGGTDFTESVRYYYLRFVSGVCVCV